jgi:hypothetical protein
MRGVAPLAPARLLALVLAAFLLLAGAACEKPDASDVTSPSARTLLGTTAGNVAYGPPEAPPQKTLAPGDWRFDIGNARFSRLENDAAAIQVVDTIRSFPGFGFEVWLDNGEATIARWSGGSTRRYSGTLCFQLRLQDGPEMLTLPPGGYTITLVYRDPGSGEVVAAHRIPVAGTPPSATGEAPRRDSRIFRDLLGCPRSVI